MRSPTRQPEVRPLLPSRGAPQGAGYAEDTEELIAWLYGWWSRIDAWISDKVTESEEALDDLTEEIVLPPTSDVSDPSTPLS